MAKLYFKYGAMGSSKTAQALITKFNYEERSMKVLFLKPSVDSRDGEYTVKSRVGLSSKATVVSAEDNIYELFEKNKKDHDVVIVDECQFLTEKQVDELLNIVVYFDVPVLCFGLRTDFATHMFPGSKRLFEVADSISEIKSICKCGTKATVNARFDENGKIIYEGEQICLGGNDRYVAMCIKCWLKEKNAKKSGLVTNIIKTKNLTLRPLKEDDAQAIYDIRSDVYNLRFVRMHPYDNIKSAQSFINSTIQAVNKKIVCFWGICENNSDHVIGTICLWNFSNDGLTAEVGYELLANHQGKKLMTEALQAVIDYGFNYLKINKIEGVTHKDNIASNSLLKNNKFKYIGKLQELLPTSDEEDMLVYHLFNE